MVIETITLNNFRNYENLNLSMDAGVNVLLGDNATGKTNLIEALALVSTGESFRAKRIEEMVRFGQEWGRVGLKIRNEDQDEELELAVMVSAGEVMGKKIRKRIYFINNVSKAKVGFVGLMPSVVFRPEDLELMDGSPGVRRGFLDRTLCQVDSEYRRSLSTYEQALMRRNKLLDAIRDGIANKYSLTFWNGLLVKHGQEMERKRDELVEQINTLWMRSDLFNRLKMVYDKSLISETRLAQYKDEELAAGYTLVGPHKDDFRIQRSANSDQQERDLAVYGSRGEQRMAVLALKLGEIYFAEDKGEEKPLLLLDDIFSELDRVHRKEVMRVMSGRQVIVTTAMKEDLDLFAEAKVIEL